MSLSPGVYGPVDDAESHKTLKTALEIGCTFWDTAVLYGAGHNESLIGDFFKANPGARDEVTLASKCAFDIHAPMDVSGTMTASYHSPPPFSRSPIAPRTLRSLSRNPRSASARTPTSTISIAWTRTPLSRRASPRSKSSRTTAKSSTLASASATRRPSARPARVSHTSVLY